MVADTKESKFYFSIIVTNNVVLGYHSGNMLDACISENLFQLKHFLFRMKPTAAPGASKRSMAT